MAPRSLTVPLLFLILPCCNAEWSHHSDVHAPFVSPAPPSSQPRAVDSQEGAARSSALTVGEAKQSVDERWSDDVTGEVWLEEMTPQRASDLCLARAKLKAVEQVAGVRIVGGSLVKNAALLADWVSAQSHALVKRVKEERWEFETVQKRIEDPPQMLYRVRLKGLVAVDRADGEEFTVQVALNRDSYESGDEMQIIVQSDQDAYLTIFNVVEDDKVTVLLPNRFKMDRAVRKGGPFRFPDPESPIKLKPIRSSKSATTTEAIMVVATRENIDLVGHDFTEAGFLDSFTQTGLLQTVWGKFMAIHPTKRALAVQPYTLEVRKTD